VAIESRTPQSVLVELDGKGHRFELLGAHSTEMGRGNAVMHDAGTGVNFGASDSRADGAAIPEPVR
jgi:gamma-glutamyltranspeptidase/glutathione hydrolase